MKKNVIALLLAVVMASGNVGTVPALAAEATTQEAVAVEEETVENAEEAPTETEDAGTGEVSEDTTETEPVDETEEVPEQELAEEADTTEEASDETEVSEETEEALEEETVEESAEEAGTTEKADATEKEDIAEDTEEIDSAVPADTSAEMTEEEEPDAITEEGTTEVEAKEADLAEEGDVVDSGTCGDNATWKITGTGDDLTLTISGSGDMDEFSESNIPWASEMTKIKTVVVEDGVTGICSAFRGLDGLTSITIPGSVKSIEDGAFSGCSSLTNLTIGVTYIADFSFASCSNLKSVTISDGVKVIGWAAFGGCNNLTSITIPDSVTSFGESAFAGCSSLTNITIPDSVTDFGAVNTFSGCSSLTSITIPDSVTDLGDNTFEGCSSLTRITIPDSVTFIGYEVFKGCSSLTSITIPDSVKYIENNSFVGCDNLIIYVYSDCYAMDYAKQNNIEYHIICNHVWNEDYTVDKEATCTQDGSESIHCSICGEIDESTIRVIPMTGHIYEWFCDSEPTCTEKGIYFGVCVYCGDSITREEDPIHQWNEDYTVDKEATCTEEGTESIHCSVCDAIDESTVRAIEKKEHAYSDWTVTKDATCSEEGSREKVCTDCGDKVIEAIDTVEHIWDTTYTVDKKATYTEAGSKSIHCSVCNSKKDGSTVAIARIKKPVNLLTISGITIKTYTGKAQTQAVVVKDGTATLKNGTHYTVSYKNNTNAGTASVVITGKGNYTGTVTKTFTINKAANAITAGNFTKAYSTKAQSFSLGAKATGGTLTYASNNKSVTVDNAGKVTVKAKFIGNAAITITAQNANYNQAIKRITITVNPTKTKIAKLSSPAAGKMTVKWKKNTSGKGYQIQYSTSSKFKGAKTATVSKNKVVTKTISGLKKGKKYYVRVRTYKAVGKLKFYSGWSTVKKVAIKK